MAGLFRFHPVYLVAVAPPASACHVVEGFVPAFVGYRSQVPHSQIHPGLIPGSGSGIWDLQLHVQDESVVCVYRPASHLSGAVDHLERSRLALGDSLLQLHVAKTRQECRGRIPHFWSPAGCQRMQQGGGLAGAGTFARQYRLEFWHGRVWSIMDTLAWRASIEYAMPCVSGQRKMSGCMLGACRHHAGTCRASAVKRNVGVFAQRQVHSKPQYDDPKGRQWNQYEQFGNAAHATTVP